MFIKHFLLAIQFFTRIPITGKLAAWVGYSAEMLRASAAHFAGVGWVVGAVAAGVYIALEACISSPYSPLIAACFSTVATLLLTGG
ncbi:MAG: adenosylcobinamide-GDP ribazoletransferase, partial [Brachymonas sp.]